MRLDIVLKYLCLAKSRSIAKTLCDDGFVHINGAVAWASATVRVGDAIVIRAPGRSLSIKIVEVPARQVGKTDAPRHYRVV